MKCINCYRDIDYGLKFCPKCGFMQPGDRAAYETEHPELANAMPMNEISEEVNPLANVTPTAISREEFVRFISSDPHCNDIIEMVDDGVDTYGLLDSPAIEVWYAKCAELIDDKQGFYPYFLKLLSQHPNKARNLLLSQAAADMNLANWQQNTGNNSTAPQAPEPQIAVNGEIIPPLPPALPSESTKIAKPPLDKGKSAAPVHSTLEKTPLSSPISVAPSQDKTVECPICHQTIPFGTQQCPYCKQQLDWSHATPPSEEKDKSDESSKRGILWILLSLVIALILGCAGYFIYTAVKDNSRSSRHNEESYIMGPIGYPQADARRAVNELIELIEDAEINSQDDFDRLENEMKEIQNTYENYYRERNRLDEFNYEIDKLENDPEMKRRVENATERLLNQAQNI